MQKHTCPSSSVQAGRLDASSCLTRDGTTGRLVLSDRRGQQQYSQNTVRLKAALCAVCRVLAAVQ